MADMELVVTRDRSTGRIHRRARDVVTGHLLDFGRCNLERQTAGRYDIILPSEAFVAPLADRCRHCWPMP